MAFLGGFNSIPAAAEEMPFDPEIVLPIIAAHAADTDRLPEELESVFQEVHVLETSIYEILPAGIRNDLFRRLALDLWSDHQPYATLVCQSFNSESRSFVYDATATDPDEFTHAVLSDFNTLYTRRLLCTFDYWDPEVAANQFIKQATIWRSTRIGIGEVEDVPIAVSRTTVVNYDLAALGGSWAMTIARVSAGAEAQVTTAILFDATSG
tara:strand:+ start:743 stop:1372 length:630 start_codon:yes stop_codon:yes gene_type:complete